MARARRSRGFVALCLVTVVAWAPLAGLLAGAFLASVLDCRVDEGSVHPCIVAGIDLGSVLYGLTVGGWLILGLWPLMLLTLVLWLGWLVWAIARRVRLRRSSLR
jgi:hypothetical protein